MTENRRQKKLAKLKSQARSLQSRIDTAKKKRANFIMKKNWTMSKEAKENRLAQYDATIFQCETALETKEAQIRELS